MAINRDWVCNQAYRLSLDIQVISNFFLSFDNLFELITKIRFSNNSFEGPRTVSYSICSNFDSLCLV